MYDISISYSICVSHLFQRIAGTKVFGVPIPSLVEEGEKIPVFLENLIMLVENHGLFTEGIYRKSGSAQKMKMLKMALDNGTTGLYKRINCFIHFQSTLYQTTMHF